MTLSFESRIDWAYLIILSIALVLLVLPAMIRGELTRVIRFNVTFTLLAILLIEVLFVTNIFTHISVRPSSFFGGGNHLKVERLDRNPWYKFAPLVSVSSIGYRGKDFEYTWVTDRFGYKNTELFFDYYDYLALGDSFTEGMGVATDGTWPSILGSEVKKTIFNGGVQGYAASQFLGTLELLNGKLKFGGVIVGHLPAIYTREMNYVSKPLRATGGIESIRHNEAQKISLALPQIFKALGVKIRSTLNDSSRSNFSTPEKFKPYLGEIPRKEDIDSKDGLEKDGSWKKLIESYRQIADFCKAQGIPMYLVAFPGRHEVYFASEHSEGNQYYTEYRLLQKELSSHKVIFIDTFPALVTYAKVSTKEELPYLQQDGHLSKFGNKIVADVVASYVR
jgi:hypothetical protein